MVLTVRGYVEDISSKCGIRYISFGATEPYNHSMTIEVEGDEGREDDDSLTEDLWPFCSGEVEVRADLREGYLFAQPSSFRAISPDRNPTGGDAQQGSVEDESRISSK